MRALQETKHKITTFLLRSTEIVRSFVAFSSHRRQIKNWIILLAAIGTIVSAVIAAMTWLRPADK